MRGGNIQHLKDLLGRYSQLQAPEGTVVDVFVVAVKSVCGISITKESVKYSVTQKTIGLKFAGPRKTEIILHAKEILAACAQDLGGKNAPRTIV